MSVFPKTQQKHNTHNNPTGIPVTNTATVSTQKRLCLLNQALSRSSLYLEKHIIPRYEPNSPLFYVTMKVLFSITNTGI